MSPTETLRNPFIATDTLPASIRFFVMWQNEIKGLTGSLIHAVTNPDEVEQLKKVKKTMSKAWDRFLEFMRGFLDNVSNLLEENIVALSYLEDIIEQEIIFAKDNKPEIVDRLVAIKNNVSNLKKEAQNKKDTYDQVDAETTSPDDYTRIENDISNHVLNVGKAFSSFFNTVKSAYESRWGKSTKTAGADPTSADASDYGNPYRGYRRTTETGTSSSGSTDDDTESSSGSGDASSSDDTDDDDDEPHKHRGRHTSGPSVDLN